jgi:hypothetical protein
MWTNIRDDLGKEGHDLSKAVLHTFRHTCATRLAKRLPLQLVQKWLGRSSIAIRAMFYTTLRPTTYWMGLRSCPSRGPLPNLPFLMAVTASEQVLS